jgi:hypothetical protein
VASSMAPSIAANTGKKRSHRRSGLRVAAMEMAGGWQRSLGRRGHWWIEGGGRDRAGGDEDGWFRWKEGRPLLLYCGGRMNPTRGGGVHLARATTTRFGEPRAIRIGNEERWCQPRRSEQTRTRISDYTSWFQLLASSFPLVKVNPSETRSPNDLTETYWTSDTSCKGIYALHLLKTRQCLNLWNCQRLQNTTASLCMR